MACDPAARKYYATECFLSQLYIGRAANGLYKKTSLLIYCLNFAFMIQKCFLNCTLNYTLNPNDIDDIISIELLYFCIIFHSDVVMVFSLHVVFWHFSFFLCAYFLLHSLQIIYIHVRIIGPTHPLCHYR